jgi:carbonic anhydrase/acetyltransferase-like protein (isoleucine patch superfamily)
VILPHHGQWPEIHETAFIAPSADIIGEVAIGEASSVWFQVVIRGDVMPIKIGSRTNIQDHSMLHCTRRKASLAIGDEVTVGHRVMLHGCQVGNRVLIGMGAILMDHVEVGDDCIIGAGALLTQGMKVPPRSLVFGSPAKVVRELKVEEIEFLKKSAENYVGDSREYRSYVQGPTRLGRDDRDLSDMRSLESQMGEYNDLEELDELEEALLRGDIRAAGGRASRSDLPRGGKRKKKSEGAESPDDHEPKE